MSISKFCALSLLASTSKGSVLLLTLQKNLSVQSDVPAEIITFPGGISAGNLTTKYPAQFPPLNHRLIFRRLFVVILKISSAITSGIVKKYCAGLLILYLNYNLYSISIFYLLYKYMNHASMIKKI